MKIFTKGHANEMLDKSEKLSQLFLTVANLSSFAFCIFMVVFMSVVLSNRNNSHARLIFKRLIWVVVACLTADMLTYVFDGMVFYGSHILHAASMFASVLTTVCMGCAWNVFFDAGFHIHSGDKKRLFLYLLPVFVTFFCLVANVFNGYLFSIDDDNVYSRGSLAFISFVLQYLLMAVLFVRAIIYKHVVKTVRYSKLRVSFIWVALISLVFGISQIAALGKVAFHCYGVTASIFIMFLRFQDDQITHDVLTGLNNRYALDEYLEDRIKFYPDGGRGMDRLYLIMMDVNDFKHINDVYGHPEGDRALITVSTALKEVSTRYKVGLFISRFGGDEFAAVIEASSERKVKEFCNKVKDAVYLATADEVYRLTIGAGYALYTGRAMHLAVLYEIADKALYDDKERMKPGG